MIFLNSLSSTVPTDSFFNWSSVTVPVDSYAVFIVACSVELMFTSCLERSSVIF